MELPPALQERVKRDQVLVIKPEDYPKNELQWNKLNATHQQVLHQQDDFLEYVELGILPSKSLVFIRRSPPEPKKLRIGGPVFTI